MEVTLDLKKSIEENAAIYFEESKKAKKKSEGAKIAVGKAKQKLEVLKSKEAQRIEQESIQKEWKEKKELSKKWYHKFRWFMTSDGFLVIGGRDATSNEIVVKKQTEKDDVVFHTELPASPFVIIKTQGKKVSDTALGEAAAFTADFSSAWKRGLSFADVFYVNPDQVTKQAQSGEYLSKGAFMIYGKKNFVRAQMNLAIGATEDEIMSGPIFAIRTHCKKYVEIVQGDEKLSDVAKIVQKKIGGELDEIIRLLPQGCKIK